VTARAELEGFLEYDEADMTGEFYARHVLGKWVATEGEVLEVLEDLEGHADATAHALSALYAQPAVPLPLEATAHLSRELEQIGQDARNIAGRVRLHHLFGEPTR
jgi:hypothetical protein